ncbi:nitroreductase family protein [Eubacterium oxidoreducens]|uniref:Nitroreductase n=1 Tax=Eubacterium oxidoreducens TaxID=1732 RepID=A0A1G6BCC5_EUBOX|nr:nitroreductase family protein [Eubacterium oxidoreducens]SDB18281.1 Nitroreductase [Eubacterium oxidoreducens]
METKKIFQIRKSVRSYTGKVTDEQIQEVLFAAQAAPVGMAKYDTIHLTVIKDRALLDEIDQAAAKFFGDPSKHPLYGAPVLIVVSTQLDAQGNNNVHYANAAMIIHNMALAAIDLGLGSVDIYGAVAALNQNPALVAKLNLPDGFVPVGATAFGETTETFEEREIPMNRIATDVIG